MVAPYQIVFVRAADDAFSTRTSAELTATIHNCVTALGVDPSEVEVVIDPSPTDVRYTGPVVAAFFGAGSIEPSSELLVDELQTHSTFILPIVPTLSQYSTYVPPSLGPLNGFSPDHTDPSHVHIATRLVEELRLLRRKRLAFISYKRSDARGVADQLHDALERRHFEVFLDTYSVEHGVDFQSVLWDCMGNTDLIVLLDTPNAFDSKWVEAEIAQANLLTLGVLQLVWPGNRRTRGTEFTAAIYLDEIDFTDPPSRAGATAKLTDAMLGRIAVEAEIVRAKSMAARRRRVVEDCQRQAEAAGLTVSIHEHGYLQLGGLPGARQVHILPVVGHPNSVQLHEFSKLITDPKIGVALMYDPLGLLEDKASHLLWLNNHLPPKTVALLDIANWLKGLTTT